MQAIQNDTTRSGVKVALWEIRKLVWNKSFMISLLLTPVIWGAFIGLPRLFEIIDEPVVPPTTYMYIVDEIGIYGALSKKVTDIDNLVLRKHIDHKDDLRNRIEGDANAGYVHITEKIFETRTINVITGTGDTYIPSAFKGSLKEILTRDELAGHNVETGEIDKIIAGYFVSISPLIGEEVEDPMDVIRKWTPPIFAMIIFFMVFMSGMTTMQSAISDKRDKMVEILLSSVSANSLMYGKIIGNFIAGLIQLAVYLIYALMFLHFLGFPGLGRIPVDQLLSFILSPQLPLLLLFALLGYLLFSSIYAGLGATMEDIQNAGNFQGIVMILPGLAALFISPVVGNPEGIIAMIGSYLPFTASIVMILRITLLDLSLVEIVIPMAILLVSTMFMAKLAGKIFRTGILMYGKEADPKEMWKWLRQ